MKGKIMIMWFLNRLKEPSTYAGFAGFAFLLGLDPNQWNTISAAAIGVSSLLAMVLKEKR